MAEYIEREAAKRIVDDIDTWSSGWRNYAKLQMDSIPAADVVSRDCYDRLLAENDELRKERPVRHGRWLSMDTEKVIAMDDDGCPVDSCRCSECGDWLTGSDEYMVRGRFCPNCGARMDGDGDV